MTMFCPMGTIEDRAPAARVHAASRLKRACPLSQKVGEAVETAVAALSEGDDRLLYEMADLVYHCMVLLAAKELPGRRRGRTGARFK